MRKSKLIYYLDDDRDDLYFFKNATGNSGDRVYTFSDGYELLQTLQLQGEKPDVIFLDIHMPVMNGQEILVILKKSQDYKHIPVVMVSGAYPKKLIRYFTIAGADYLMKKPCKTGDLKAELQKVLGMDFLNHKISA